MDHMIIGRKREQEELRKIFEAEEATFLAIYGRRRIGKTYLIRNFFKEKGVFFHLTGIQDAPLEVQLQNFTTEFSDVFFKGKPIEKPKNWFAAFQLLRKEVQKVPKKTKAILFFDELPWLSTPRSSFLQALEYFWNRYLSEMPNAILIVCGSAASWMIDHIINSKGGFHGRVTKQIRLLPFSLRETEEFLQKKKIEFNRKQILELYICLGGVAKYLSYLERGKSVAQSIGELCFSYNAPLISEFHKLYRSLFLQYEDHIAIVRALAKTKSGLSYRQLAEQIKAPTGGSLSKRLEELKQSGFIAVLPLFGKGEKNHQYLLVDEYSLFYLTWIAGIPSLDLQSRGADYWLKQRNTQSWKSWTGHAFEILCLKHVEELKAALGLAAVQTRASKWKKLAKKRGAEIDLIIDRADQCLNLCEIKFYEKEFVLTKDYAEALRRKKLWLEEHSEAKKSTFTTLITTYGAKHNSLYRAVVDQELTMDALFTER